MKSVTGSLAIETILTLIAPGFLVVVAALIACPSVREDPQAIANSLEQTQILIAFTLLIACVLAGGILAVSQGFIESNCLDNRAAIRLKLSREEYDTEWRRYLVTLDGEGGRNPYVSRQVLFYQFESCAGLAGTILAASLLLHVSWCWALLVGLVSVFVYFGGVSDHYALASRRHLLHGSSPGKD